MEENKPDSDRELDEKERKLIRKISPDELNKIDRALLDNVGSHWQKMSKIVGLTMMKLPNRIVGLPDAFYAKRLRLMVEKDVLEAKGILSNMRCCELRLKGEAM